MAIGSDEWNRGFAAALNGNPSIEGGADYLSAYDEGIFQAG